MRILLIDDSEDIRFIARLALEQVGGMDVIMANGGEEGVLLAAKEQQLDCILLDIVMPGGMDGVATLAALKADDRTSSVPVIFLTARSQAEDVERLERMDVVGVIAKPFAVSTLAGQVRELVDSRA